jgi:8-oxo-dGTP diphosphatase
MNDDQQSPHFPNCFHRVTVKGLFVKDGKIMLVKEPVALSGKWELPGGGLDFGEDIYAALKREFMEEMGLEVRNIDKRPLYIWTWKYNNRRNMDWYYSLVVTYKVELTNLNFKKTEECEDIGFFSKEELQTLDLATQANGLKEFFDPEDFS